MAVGEGELSTRALHSLTLFQSVQLRHSTHPLAFVPLPMLRRILFISPGRATMSNSTQKDSAHHVGSSIASPTQNGSESVDMEQRKAEHELVGFEGDNDPLKPLNWPMSKKVANTVLYSLCTMAGTWASTM